MNSKMFWLNKEEVQLPQLSLWMTCFMIKFDETYLSGDLLLQGCPILDHEGHNPAGFPNIQSLFMAEYVV